MPTPAKYTASILLAIGIFLAGYMANRQAIPVASSASVAQSLHYTCPMHPQYQSDHNGSCPICGMSLVPVSADGSLGNPNSVASAAGGVVQIHAGRQQLIGIRTDEVRRAPASSILRVPGRIAVDDGRLCRITAAADGWIREIGQNSAGTYVKRNQVLASYYTQNLLSSAQTFVFAMQTNAQVERGEVAIGSTRTPTVLSLQVALDSLRSLGMSEFQIDEIRQNKMAPNQIYLYSPIDGFVLTRNVSPEQRFDKGTELFRIADISHIWVMTDVFEKDREFLKPGAKASVQYQGHEFQARMSDALPQFDPESRTLKTRFELDNPGFILRPDMFVDVNLRVDMPESVTVPAEAVIDLGRRRTVYVSTPDGRFEPRAVETGWRLGERVQITRGLEPGEHIVVSGNFLVDSESRMRLVAMSAASAADGATAVKDPVCGMDVDPKAANTLKIKLGGKTYYFCSEKCRNDFQANPAKYVHEMAALDATAAPASR
jgi:membrane fusion protein, copper/silver efflux system